MQDDCIVLRRFKKFKAMFLSSNVPNDLLLDMIESFITSEDDDTQATELALFMDGQMSLVFG